MGYQEAFRPIEHLAESAGIKKAIEEYKDKPNIPEYCKYDCTTRRRDSGALYAVIIGQRCRVHIVSCDDIDDYIPYDEQYSDYYEDLDESLVEEAAKEHPELVEQAYKEVTGRFESYLEYCRKQRRREEERDAQEEKEASELWPAVAEMLGKYGSLPLDLLSRYPAFKDHSMYCVMTRLSDRGLVTCAGKLFEKICSLTDEARESLGIESPPPKLNKREEEERIVKLLGDFGALGMGVLSRGLGRSTSYTRARVYKLIDEGSVVPEGNGTARKYRLVA